MKFDFLRTMFNPWVQNTEAVTASSNKMQRALQATSEAVEPVIGRTIQAERSNWEHNRKNARNDDEAITGLANDLIKSFEDEGRLVPAFDLARSYESSVPELNGRLIGRVLSLVRADIEDRLSKGLEERVKAIGELGVVARQLPDGSRNQKEIIGLWRSEVSSLAKTDLVAARNEIAVAISPLKNPLRTAAEEVQKQLGSPPNAQTPKAKAPILTP